MENNIICRYLKVLCELVNNCIYAGEYAERTDGHKDLCENIYEAEMKIAALLDVACEQDVLLTPEYLIGRYNLNRPEALSIRLAFAYETDAGLQRSYRGLTGRTSLGTGFFLDTFSTFKNEDNTIVDNMSLFAESSKLMRFIFEFTHEHSESIRERQLHFRRRIRGFLFEKEYFSHELCDFAELYEPEESLTKIGGPLPLENIEMATELSRFLSLNPHTPICIYGNSGTGKTRAIKQICAERNLPLIFIDALPSYKAGRELMTEINAEAYLSGAAVCFRMNSGFESVDTGALADAAMIFAITEDIDSFRECADNRFVIYGEFPIPGEQLRQKIWKDSLLRMPGGKSVNAKGLAGKYTLSGGQIREICNDAAMRAAYENGGVITQKIIYESCHRKLTSKVRNFKIQKITPAYEWDELILPEYPKRLLEAACDQPENYGTVYERWGFGAKLPYGRGLSMLFAGPPGTGKTMGAQVVAGRLGLELYKVNLAGIVSKYIGETEKNLEEIFSIAEQNQAILFFDESDVLFSKRTEIKDSNDKYSNMEAAYMLQRVEEYRGICILATNYMQNFDEAFKRRIKFIIDFPFPDAVHREKLWRSVFPASAPLDDNVDYSFLANHFELSGSNIKNIALNAAFEAAAEGISVGMKHILQALRVECLKNGKHVSEIELGEYYMLFER